METHSSVSTQPKQRVMIVVLGALVAVGLAAVTVRGAGETTAHRPPSGVTAFSLSGSGAAAFSPSGSGAANGLDALEFLIGDWVQTGTIAPESFGSRAGGFAGPVICEWGAFRTWIVCDHWTEELADLGRYAVHVVIRSDADSGKLVGLVVNPYGSASYEGGLETPDRLVFTGGRVQVQHVVYEKLTDGRIRFTVDASQDGGATFVPHTDGIWERTGR